LLRDTCDVHDEAQNEDVETWPLPQVAKMTNSQVRRSGRISRSVPILLIGHDAEGTVFSEETKTVVLSRHGAGIVSFHTLVAEQELAMRWLENDREADIRVVGEIGSQGAMHTYGVAFVDPDLDFWEIEFPPAPSQEYHNKTLPVVCTGCGSEATLQQGDYEADVCTIHGGLVRYCTSCGLSTLWRRYAGSAGFVPLAASVPLKKMRKDKEATVALADPPFVEQVRPVATPPDQEPFVNRRDRVRAKVNFFAAVRSDAFGEDIVRCIDMSRGGLSFRTKYAYKVGAMVRVAVPFSPEAREAPAIFVPAKIANLKWLESQECYRCGVKYLPAGDVLA
jgi:PilZ domain